MVVAVEGEGEGEDDAVRCESIKVLIRIRPLVALELESEDRSHESVVEAKPTEVVLHGREARHQLRCGFDTVLGQGCNQEDVYAQVGDCVDRVARGFNATILAYGQTGSGKTHTMFGGAGWSEHEEGWASGGIIPRCVAALFEVLPKDATVFASFVQIYREQVFDMLRDGARSSALEIHQEEDGDGTFVAGLSEYAARSARDCVDLIRAGEENCAVLESITSRPAWDIFKPLYLAQIELDFHDS